MSQTPNLFFFYSYVIILLFFQSLQFLSWNSLQFLSLSCYAKKEILCDIQFVEKCIFFSHFHFFTCCKSPLRYMKSLFLTFRLTPAQCGSSAEYRSISRVSIVFWGRGLGSCSLQMLQLLLWHVAQLVRLFDVVVGVAARAGDKWLCTEDMGSRSLSFLSRNAVKMG